MVILYILAMLLLFSLSIFVHELGHFLAARAFGMVADVFSIGMGRALWKKQVGATTYQIGLLPFGGFVSLPQMDPNSFLEGTSSGDRVQDPGNSEPRILPRVSPWKKMIVSVAGAGGNLVFAFLLATIVWLVGKPTSLPERNGIIGFIATNSPALALGVAVGDEIVAIDGQPVGNWQQILEKTALGPERTVALRLRVPGGAEREVALRTEKSSVGLWMLPGLDGMDPCHIAEVEKDLAAAAAGLQPGDQLLRYGGQEIFSRPHLSQMVDAAAGRPVEVEFRRGGGIRTAMVGSRYNEKRQRYMMGVAFNTLSDLDYGQLSHPSPWAQVRDHATGIFRFLNALTTPATAGAVADQVGGPVLILRMLYLMVEASFILAIWFTGFLNVNLAIINLLPLPILDGGHVVMNLWELIARRPAPPKLVNALANLFAVLFISLFLFLTFRDSARQLVPPFQRWLHGEGAASEAPASPGEKPDDRPPGTEEAPAVSP